MSRGNGVLPHQNTNLHNVPQKARNNMRRQLGRIWACIAKFLEMIAPSTRVMEQIVIRSSRGS